MKSKEVSVQVKEAIIWFIINRQILAHKQPPINNVVSQLVIVKKEHLSLVYTGR